MKVSYGEFQNNLLSEEKKVQELFTGLLKDFSSQKFEEMFVAYPHLIYSNEFEPKIHSEKTLELYLWSLPELFGNSVLDVKKIPQVKIGGKIFKLQYEQSDFILLKSIPEGFKAIIDDDGIVLAVYQKNQVWTLFDTFGDFNSEITTPIIMYILESLLNS